MKTTVRVPITDVASWIDGLPDDSRRALVTLGELLAGVVDHRPLARAENAELFTRRGLGVHDLSDVLNEDRELTGFQRLTVPMALGPLIAVHSAEVGPDGHTSPPAFTQTEVGGTVYRHPQCLRAIFPAGSLVRHAPVVIGIEARSGLLHVPRITAYVRREHQNDAHRILDSIADQAEQLNPYRGRILRASMEQGELWLKVIDLPSMTRTSVVVDDSIWREIDLGLAAVRDHHAMLNACGLGSRRGLLLVGPPGTGKSAVSAVAAREALQSGFTVIYVEAKAGERLLTAVVEEAQRLGGPMLMILEDVDLIVRDRRRESNGDGAH